MGFTGLTYCLITQILNGYTLISLSWCEVVNSMSLEVFEPEGHVAWQASVQELWRAALDTPSGSRRGMGAASALCPAERLRS